MAVSGELLVCGCRREDLVVLRNSPVPGGPRIREVSKLVEVVRLAVASRPLAVVLGVGLATVENLDVIAVIRQVWPDLPVIVVAEDDSLELERRARQTGLFYYSVHPLGVVEMRAVLGDLVRRGERPDPRRH